MHLRVNADDLGLTARINDESFDLISRRLVDSASIIVNAHETEDAIRRARRFPQCRFGVHLNVAQFQPLRPSAGFAPVLDEDGNFQNVFWRVRKDSSLKRAVYREWSAQIERCLELGLRPVHIDSHHDVHLMPEFLPLVLRLQRRFGIRRVRRGTKLPGSTRKFRHAIRDGIWTARCMLSGSKLTHYRCGLREFWMLIESGARLAEPTEYRRLELIVHPGNEFDPVFRKETELLRTGWLERARELGFTGNSLAVSRLSGHPEMR